MAKRTSYPAITVEWREFRAVSLCIDGGVAHSAVFTRHIHGTVARVTAKAIQIELQDRKGKATIWFPKAAIKSHQATYDVIHTLAHWFQPDTAQWRTIERFQSIGGVSAA